jgi:hypothetical protein
MATVVYPIRVLAKLGVKNLISASLCSRLYIEHRTERRMHTLTSHERVGRAESEHPSRVQYVSSLLTRQNPLSPTEKASPSHPSRRHPRPPRAPKPHRAPQRALRPPTQPRPPAVRRALRRVLGQTAPPRLPRCARPRLRGRGAPGGRVRVGVGPDVRDACGGQVPA